MQLLKSYLSFIFQGNFVYRMIGYQPATFYFKIDETDGRITVRVPPMQDPDESDTYTVSMIFRMYIFYYPILLNIIIWA